MNNCFKCKSHLFTSALLGLLAFFLLFPGILGDNLLLQGDEVMHIKTIRESLDASSFLHPILSGFSNPYKPPLLFWAGMLGKSLMGTGLLGERIPSVVFGTLSVLLVFWILLEMGTNRRYALLVSVFFLISMGVFKFSKIAMMEIYLVFFLLLGLYFYLIYLNTNQTRFLVLSALSTGLGGLLKGPILLVYAGIFLVTHWVLSRVRIRDGKTVWNGKPRALFLAGLSIPKFLFLWSPLALLPLFAWILAIVIFTDQGLAFTKFFLFTENLGKFGQDNQPESRILLGILLYTIPWTVLYIKGSYFILREKERSKRQFIAKWILLSSIYLIILHLLPNRKDPYYALPSISTAMIALGLGLSRERWKDILISKTHIAFQIFLAVILILGGWFFKSNFLVFLSLPMFFAIYGILSHWITKQNTGLYLSSGIVAPILSLLLFQTTLLAEIPDRIPKIETEIYPEICVVSTNPWTAWEIENYTPGLKVNHSPFVDKKCLDSSLPILVTEEKDKSSIPQNYTLVESMNIWGNEPEIIEFKFYRYDEPIFYKNYYLFTKQKGKN